MYIIDKSNIANYRFAVAKETFLQEYNEYELCEDLKNSNCMKMKKDGEGVIVSIFSKPKIKIDKNEKILVFYDDKHYSKEAAKEKENNVEIIELSSGYMRKYDEMFEKAIKHPKEYLKSVERRQEQKAISYEDILIGENNIKNHERMLYKYYAKDTIIEKKYGVIDGNISFVDPNMFNDPFDVNCFFANDSDMSKLFRILCVTFSYREILMWSYYGSNHEGYCLEYKEQDVLDIILKLDFDGLCIVGDVEYKDKRPKQKSKLNSISITELNFYVQAAFTKYTEWNHEKEYRYVLLSDSFEGKEPYIEKNITIQKVIAGCRNNDCDVKDSNGNIKSHIKLSKDSQNYKLQG